MASADTKSLIETGAFHLVHPVDAGARTVIIGWTMGAEGRKFESGTALFDAQGTLCAYAKATWFGF